MYTKGNENPLTVNIYIQYSKWMEKRIENMKNEINSKKKYNKN